MRIGSSNAVQYSAVSIANVILVGYGAEGIVLWKTYGYGISIEVVSQNA